MSTVYLAVDETLDRRVAIKLLHAEISDQPDQLERFRREARSAARLSHPNLVSVIDAGEDDGRPYIVFEYVEGETLKRRIQDHGPLPVAEALAYAIEIGRALDAAHERKLVHRDVKPQNVLIDAEGHAKVTDFGIARSLEAKGLTATGRVLGTTDYVSPEQAMGEVVDERTDVYSLGVVLYEMLTGDVPFQAETQVGVAMKHVNEELPDVFELRPDISAAVAGVVDNATAKHPGSRYNSISEMVRDLEATLEVEAARAGGTTGEATTVLRSVPGSRRRLPGRRGLSRAGIAMGLIGLALIGAALAVNGGNLPEIGDGGGSEPSAAGGEVPIASATDFDPSGTGAPGEHPEAVHLAVDGNPTTRWITEEYEGALNKEGVGIYVETESPTEVTAVELQLSQPGADVEIYAAPGQSAPQTLTGWGSPIGEATDLGTRDRIDVTTPSPSSLYLIWFTDLPPKEPGSDTLQAQLAEVTLFD
jgi:tRNA A-37 threonylcarbamoyl transferase component Bud32